MFENRSFTAQEIVLKSIKDAKEWSNAQNVHTLAETPLSHNARLPCPPPTIQPGVLVCKVDAAWNSTSGTCGIGGIFSGSLTTSLPTISESRSHVSSALMAEAIAVHRAVSLAVYSNV